MLKKAFFVVYDVMIDFVLQHFIEDSDVLWQKHCQKEFKVLKRDTETWRELYIVSQRYTHTHTHTHKKDKKGQSLPATLLKRSSTP